MKLSWVDIDIMFAGITDEARVAVPTAPVNDVITGLAAVPVGAGIPLDLFTTVVARGSDLPTNIVVVRDALVALGELVARADPGTRDEWVGPAHDRIASFLVDRLSPDQFTDIHWRMAQAVRDAQANMLSPGALVYARQHLSDHLWLAGRTGEALDAVARLETPADNLALWQMWKERLSDLDPHDPNLLGVRANIATWTGQSGDGRKALEEFSELLPDMVHVFGESHRETFKTLGNIALWTGRTGDARGALEQFNALLRDQERALGHDDPDVLKTRVNIVTWIGESGDPRRALKLANELLTDQERVIGPDHPDTLNTRASIALWAARSGDASGALYQLGSLLRQQEEVFGPDHTDVLITRAIMLILTGQLGEYHGTLENSAELLHDQELVLGPDHPDTLRTRSNIAMWTAQSGNTQEALNMSTKLLRDKERMLGPDHPDTLAERNNLAIWNAHAGNIEEALRAAKELRSHQERVLGGGHIDTLNTRGNIAIWTARSGDVAGALKQLQALLLEQERALGPDHPTTVATRKNILALTSQSNKRTLTGAHLEAAIQRLGRSGRASPNARAVAEDLLSLGYEYLPTKSESGGTPENYLKAIDPPRGTTAVAYLTPTYLEFTPFALKLVPDLASRADGEVRGSGVKFSYIKNARPALDAAKFYMEQSRKAQG